MATSRDTRPVIGVSFQTDSLDPGDIHDKLNQLWLELDDARRDELEHGDNDVVSHIGGGLMRANTLNLLAVARNEHQAELVTGTVAHLRDFLPSRTIVLVNQPDQESEFAYDVELGLKEQETAEDRPNLRFETIVITSNATQLGHLASFFAPLLAAELTDFLWWPGGDFPRNPLFRELLAVADRVIVDSGQLGGDISGLSTMLALMDDEDAPGPILGDFAWLRLAPWRQLIAQFFDPPDVQASLGSIEEITISYAESRDDGSSGLAAALLITGWLGSRLGWEAMDRLERRRAGGFTAPLRAVDQQGRAREVSLRLVPDLSPYARFSLRKVEILAGGSDPGTFRIERSDADDMITSSQTSTAPFVSRMVYSRRPDTGSMLGEELQRFGRDRIFEDALRFAATLVP